MLVNLIKTTYASWLDALIRFNADGSQWFLDEFGVTITEAVKRDDFVIRDAVFYMVDQADGNYYVSCAEDGCVRIIEVKADDEFERPCKDDGDGTLLDRIIGIQQKSK